MEKRGRIDGSRAEKGKKDRRQGGMRAVGFGSLSDHIILCPTINRSTVVSS
jgi:hypothetical protein